MSVGAKIADLGRDQMKRPSNENLAELAHQRLHDMILAGELQREAVLQERSLATLLNISRTPVREALNRLEAQGLISKLPGRGYLVRQISAEEVIELLDVRVLLETEAAVKAIGRIGTKSLSNWRKAVEKLSYQKQVEVRDHWAVDDMLHEGIALASGNRVLAETIAGLRRRTHIFDIARLPDRLQPGCVEHLAIIDALSDGDEFTVRRAIALHIENVKNGIINNLSGTT